MQNPNTGPGNITKFTISGNEGDTVDMTGGVVEYRYYESVLTNNVSSTATIIETGVGEGAAAKGVLDNLPIRGGEKAEISVEDAQENKIDLSVDMHVNRVRDADPGTQQDLYFIDFASKEFFQNEQTRVTERYEGKISENVSKIVEDVLGSTLVENDTTTFDLNFYGNSKKPFYMCTWLASRSVPDGAGGGGGSGSTGGSGGGDKGGAGGFLFYQTREGLYFKSLDKIFGKSATKKFIYNDTGLPVPGYDDNIISYSIGSDIDLNEKMMMGAYKNKTIFFDLVALEYKTVDFDIEEQEGKATTAGRDYIVVNEEFIKEPSRLFHHIKDIGVNPKGTGDEQLSEWKSDPKKPNFDAEKTLVQTVMRYNQMLTVQTNILIPGNFDIKAGDIVECDFPSSESKPERDKNKQTGGKYMVASVCHRVTPKETYTSLGLIRDSFGKKGGFG